MRGGILRERWCWCSLWGNNRAPMAGPLMQANWLANRNKQNLYKTLGFFA